MPHPVNTITSATGSIQKVVFAKFIATLQEDLSPSAEDKPYIDFLAHTLREHIVYLSGNLGIDAVREIVAAMPNLQGLHLVGPVLVDRFLQPDLSGPLTKKNLLPSLRRLHLDNPILLVEGWSPIISYPTHQTSGGRGISLTISGPRRRIYEDVLRKMKGLVEELVLDMTLNGNCPFN